MVVEYVVCGYEFAFQLRLGVKVCYERDGRRWGLGEYTYLLYVLFVPFLGEGGVGFGVKVRHFFKSTPVFVVD